MPFRRLCVGLGAGITSSEMAMTSSILQGHKPEWALMRAHVSELPHFGAQICANKVEQAVRTTEAITKLFPTASSGRHGLAFVDLNCGCPIDLVYKSGGGSALLDQQSKLVKILRGMNYVSGGTPVTVKIRMGTKDSNPTAQKLINKVIDCGDVQAVTLHGRSRQQRYTKSADWEYIAQTAALVKSIKAQMEVYVDTAADKERPEKRNVFFVGNGDCYSHIDYFNAVDNAKVDSVMLARGALIKPWIFEEIQSGQYLDKSASERLGLVQDYCRYGLECWGSDELGVATTRRFLLEWLSFTCRLLFLWALWSFGTDRGADTFLLEYWRGFLQRSMTGHRSGRVEMRWRLC
jgi:tRNA-dihydrouridine synthase 3